MGHVWWGPLTRFRGLVRLAFIILENEQSWAQNPGTRARPVAALPLPLPVAKASLPLTVYGCVCVCVCVSSACRYKKYARWQFNFMVCLLLISSLCVEILFYFSLFVQSQRIPTGSRNTLVACEHLPPRFPLRCATYITPWVWGMQTGTWLLWAHFGFIFVGYLLFSFCI